jgi:radical SAM superfamily enzyme YgiQ (UPF0313 family)
MAQRKVRFIEPASRPGRPFNGWIRSWPLLGPILLATQLRKRGYDAAVYNENISGRLEDNPEGMADVADADVVGLSIMTATANRGYELAGLLRDRAPQAVIAIGGPHASFVPEEAARYGDVVVRGEGENIIEAIAAGDIREGIHSPEPPQDLDALPAPDHEVVRGFNRLMRTRGGRATYELPMMTSRGCPHGCVYCSVTQMFGRKVRRQSVGKVLSDLRYGRERGFRRIFFYDDNLTTDRAWFRELLEGIKPMGLRWNGQVRIDMHWEDRGRRKPDEALLESMHDSGADVLYVGYETIDEETARTWKKGYRGSDSLVSRLLEDTAILHSRGAWIHGMFMIGPQHEQQHIDGVVDFAKRARLESMQMSVLTPLPGTRLWEDMKDDLLLTDFPADWDYYDGTHRVYRSGRMGIETLQKAMLEAHRRYYLALRPAAIRIGRLLRENIGLQAKIHSLYVNTTMARRVMKQWRRETAEFLDRLRARQAIPTT